MNRRMMNSPEPKENTHQQRGRARRPTSVRDCDSLPAGGARGVAVDDVAEDVGGVAEVDHCEPEEVFPCVTSL